MTVVHFDFIVTIHFNTSNFCNLFIALFLYLIMCIL
nr:MAG TPA: hypothetical protein [Caudoviricetes sp.]